MSDHHVFEGFTSLAGTRWVRVTHYKTAAWATYASFSGLRPKAFDLLAAQGIAFVGNDNTKHAINMITAINEFPEHPLIEQSGWNIPYYAQPNGSVAAPMNVPEAQCVFAPAHDKCHAAGDLSTWKKQVVRPLTDQPIVLFAIMLAFAAALLRLTDRVGNFGFELVGRPGSGKSTAQQLASSVMGSPGRGSNYRWWTTFDELSANLGGEVDVHADALLILEYADLFFSAETPARRANQFKTLLTQLSAGRGRGPARIDKRLMFLISAQSPLSAIIGHGSDVASASSARLITLQLGADRPYGVFDTVHEDYLSASSFADSLITAASANHGVAMPRFLECLTAACAEDEPALRKMIEEDIEHFRSRCEVDPNDGAAVRIADAFALVFVAGKLAKEYRVFPRRVQCLDTALTCYRLYKEGGAPPPPFSERLQALAALPSTVHLGKGIASPEPELLGRSTVFVGDTKGGRELWIRAADIEKVFSDWITLRGQPDVTAVMRKDKSKHLGVKRSIAGGERERVYAFRLPVPVGEGLGLAEPSTLH